MYQCQERIRRVEYSGRQLLRKEAKQTVEKNRHMWVDVHKICRMEMINWLIGQEPASLVWISEEFQTSAGNQHINTHGQTGAGATRLWSAEPGQVDSWETARLMVGSNKRVYDLKK